MSKPAGEHREDDASGEAWFQKGATLLEGRKHERELEESLRIRMFRSIWSEWLLWIGLLLGVITINLCSVANAGFYSIITSLFASLSCIIGAADSASAKRTEALLEWIELQKHTGSPPRRHLHVDSAHD